MKKITLIIAFAFLISCGSSEEKTRASILIPNAKEKVLKKLLSPSSAKFFDDKTKVVQVRNNFGDNADGKLTNKYVVKFTLDSKNESGVDVRKSYTVVYEFDGVDSLNISSYKFKDIY